MFHTFLFITDSTQYQRLMVLLVILERSFEMAVTFDPTNIVNGEKVHLQNTHFVT